MSLSMCIQEPVLLLLHFYWLPLCPLLPIFIDFSWLPPCSVFFSLRWSGLLSASSVQFSKSVTRIQRSTGLCCPTVSLIVGRICHPKFKWLILALFSIPWMWICPPIVLVLEVDGTLGEQNLLCMESPQELIGSANQSQEIFWKKNGIDQAQRGNSYRVQLEESLGGGNYTCHSEDGSLLNHTIVLIKEDKSKRRKILVTTDEGMCKFDTNYTAEKTGYILKVFVLCSLNRLVRLSQVHGSKLQRRVLLLLDLAQQPQWQSSIYQSSSVSARCTAETLSVLLTNNNKSSCMSWDCRKTSINAQLWKETCLWFLKVMYREPYSMFKK